MKEENNKKKYNEGLCNINPRFTAETFLLLKQRSKKADLTMKDYLSFVIDNHSFQQYEISTHDLSKINSNLEDLVYRAKGYYTTMLRQGELSKDLVEHINKSFLLIDETVSSYYKELIDNRQNEMDISEREIQEVIAHASKNTPPDKSVSSEREKEGRIPIWLSPSTYEKLKKDMEKSGYGESSVGYGAEITRYLTDMVNAKRFIQFSYRIDDIRMFNELLYAALKNAPAYLSVMSSQGEAFDTLRNELCGYYENIVKILKAVWHIVMNDRKELYQKYTKKIKENPAKKQKNERKRKYKEER